jgi:hypothetical protein
MYNYDNIRKTIASIRDGYFDMRMWYQPISGGDACPSCIAGHAIAACTDRNMYDVLSKHGFVTEGAAVLGLPHDQALTLFTTMSLTREGAIAQLEGMLATEPKRDLNELFNINNAPSKNEAADAGPEPVGALQYA